MSILKEATRIGYSVLPRLQDWYKALSRVWTSN